MHMEFDFENVDPKEEDVKCLGRVIKSFRDANYEIKNKFPSHDDYTMSQRIAEKMNVKLNEIEQEIKAEILNSNTVL